MLARFGGLSFVGDDNMVNPGALAHVLAETQGSVFGHEPFPSLLEKGAAIGWRIITGHVFNDGNKRTGLEACRQFLELNGYRMRIDREAACMARRIADGKVSLDDFMDWLAGRISVVP